MLKREEHKILVAIEFSNDSCYNTIAKVSNYISSIIKYNDIILTDLQVFSNRGCKITYTINYIEDIFHKRKYTKSLSKLSDWLCDIEDIKCIYKYYYSYN